MSFPHIELIIATVYTILCQALDCCLIFPMYWMPINKRYNQRNSSLRKVQSNKAGREGEIR